MRSPRLGLLRDTPQGSEVASSPLTMLRRGGVSVFKINRKGTGGEREREGGEREGESECLQTCSDVVVYPLNRHCGVWDGIPLLVLHNTPDATMHLGGGNDTVFRGTG